MALFVAGFFGAFASAAAAIYFDAGIWSILWVYVLGGVVAIVASALAAGFFRR